MSKRLADLRPSQLEEDDYRTLSLVSGLSNRGVSRRLNGAHGNSLMSSIFGAEWPKDADGLGPLTVATAMRANLVDEISEASGLARAKVRARLAGVEGKKMLLVNLFPELSVDEDEDEEERDVAQDEEDDETDSDEPLTGRQRFLDETLTFTVTELVGDIRAASLRRAPVLVEWLAARTELSIRALRSRVKNHGRSLLRTILTDVWPVRVTGPSRGMLADLTTGAVSLSPSLLRWVADVAGLGVGDARERIEAAPGNTRLARALPELVSGEDADEGRDEDDEEAEEANGPPSRAPRPKHISVAPPSTRKRIVGGRYELRGQIGSGHFGTVWAAMRLEHPNDLVVLKVARHAKAGRLREEMLIANRLRHPNICTYLAYESDPSFGEYLVMDHCGRSLHDILSTGNPLEVEQAVDVVRQAAEGLEYAHGRGVLHHDVKPGNILVEARKADAWDVRVGDFGVSVKGRTGQNTLGAHTVFGTEPVGWTDAYASPELLRGEKAGKRSDQYALGLVFCSMLEGVVFERGYAARTFARLTARQNAAVSRALSFDPQDRFDSCTAFAAALARR